MLMFNNLNSKKGSSMLEAIIASALLAISALAFSKLHVVNFQLIHTSSKTLKTSMVLADFGEKIRLKGINKDDAEKDAILATYSGWDYSLEKTTCDTSPQYVIDCTTNSNDVNVCLENDMIAYDIFNSICSIYNTTNVTLNMQAENCNTSSVDNKNLCVWVSLDGADRTQVECEEDFNDCVMLEIRI
jgi:Tfp pilus assembly protein PilV